MASAKSLIVLGAILSAGPAFAQSATLNQSGGTTAMERTAPAGERPRVVNDSENGSAEVQAFTTSRGSDGSKGSLSNL